MARKIEIASAGFDEGLQGIGGDAFGGTSAVGLRVPTLASGSPTTPKRYLFMLAAFSVSENAQARIVGMRQMTRIGFRQPPGGEVPAASAPYTVTQLVEDPAWRFQDGNVSYHLQRLGPPNSQGFPSVPSATDLRNLVNGFSMTPALLYSKITVVGPQYVNLTEYLPPNGGNPWGTPLGSGHQNTILDIRAPWAESTGWISLDMELEGPDTVALFASVFQTDPLVRPTLVTPTPFFPEGLSREEQFLKNFPNAIYWSVAGSLIVELP